MSQLKSPIIFDSTFSASIFPIRASNLSNSSIGELGVCTSLKEEMAWPWAFEFQYTRTQESGSDFIIDDVKNVHGNTTTTSAPVTPNKCITLYGHFRIREVVVKTSLT